MTGFVLYGRERRRCEALACRMTGSRISLALLILASVVVGSSIVLDRLPEATADLLARVTDAGPHASAPSHDMGGMNMHEEKKGDTTHVPCGG